MKISLIIGFIFLVQLVFSQEISRKGEVYMLWGYNRAAYAPSDIRFEGANYNFTLYHVKAKDFPSEFKPSVYFGLFSFTIPQYNYRIGYYFNDDLSLSVGLDHMKYVVKRGQSTYIDGTISNSGTQYDGDYNDVLINLDSELMTLEHTDGFNYLSVELDKHWRLWTGCTKHSCDWFAGVGAGLMIPRSDVTVLGVKAANEFHIAGEAMAFQTGFKAKFFNHFSVHTTLKAGVSRLHDILTTVNGDKAVQNVGWIQGYWQVGYIGRIGK